MDRRQRKTREAIFAAFTGLLAQKSYARITVGEIIAQADVGRATFYAHFETKDYLLKELCGELFCHIFDGADSGHSHIFHCDAPDNPFLHLFRHLMKNDNRILDLLSGENNELFMGFFREKLRELAADRRELFEGRRDARLPEDFWINHIASVFAETLRWWLENGRDESPETVTEYFLLAV